MDALELLIRRIRPDVPRQLRASMISGSRLGEGQFQLLRRLDGGSTGTVYEALDRGRKVALKVLHAIDAHQIYRLKQEFRMLADFRHPNIVEMYELFGSDRDWFITLELVRGRPLDEFWAEHTEELPDVPECAEARYGLLRDLFRQLVEGVSALHRAGLLHRDLKPSNVLVEPSGRVVILDFGLVSDKAPGGIGQTVEHSISGTPAYMAPEQARGERASPASDCYALGAMLYQLLSSRLPHSSLNSAELFRQKQLEDPTPVSTYSPNVPEDLDQLCSALLRREPGDRPTAEALLEVVRSWPRTCPPPADRPSTPRVHGLSSTWFGRHDVVPRVANTLRDPNRRGTSLVLIEGTSGIGKTSLLRRLVEHLTFVENAVVLEGRCYRRENVPYKSCDGVIDHLSRILRRLPREQSAELIPRNVDALLRLFPMLERVDSFRDAAARLPPCAADPDLQRRGVDGLRELLCRVSDRRRLVIVIDDMQWGDEDSTNLLAEISASASAPRMLVIASYSSEAATADCFLNELHLIATDRLVLAPLAENETTALALEVLGVEQEDALNIATAIAREAGGSPFYAVELASGCLSGVIDKHAPTLMSFIAHRIEELSPGTRRVLFTVIANTQPIGWNTLTQIYGHKLAAEAIEALSAMRLVRVLGERDNYGIDVYHEHVRRTASVCFPTELQSAFNPTRPSAG